VQEIKQRVRDTLFVGPDPRIRGYSGRGELRAWLRSVAVRQALKSMRDDRRGGASAGDDALGAVADDSDDPELEHLKATYASEFNRALTDALGQLSPRERNVLKQSYLDGLSIDEIGALYRVHRATAARWIARARQVLMDETRDLLIARLQMTASEIGSVGRLVASQLDVSLSRLLG
jgi:RNA polymerase sigma-70 factor (ECF subfamily)